MISAKTYKENNFCLGQILDVSVYRVYKKVPFLVVELKGVSFLKAFRAVLRGLWV